MYHYHNITLPADISNQIPSLNMAEAVVSTILGQLASVIHQHVEEEVRLVVSVDEEVKKLTSNFQAIVSVLEDAECKQVKEKAVGEWLDKLKDVSYDIEDVLD